MLTQWKIIGCAVCADKTFDEPEEILGADTAHIPSDKLTIVICTRVGIPFSHPRMQLKAISHLSAADADWCFAGANIIPKLGGINQESAAARFPSRGHFN
jgi:hypothetical protein